MGKGTPRNMKSMWLPLAAIFLIILNVPLAVQIVKTADDFLLSKFFQFIVIHLSAFDPIPEQLGLECESDSVQYEKFYIIQCTYLFFFWSQ